MNCKPGDLAIVIRGQSSGKICKVIEPSEIYKDGWYVEFPREVPTSIGMSVDTNVCDAWLRPVNGLPGTEVAERSLQNEVSA